MNFRLLGPKPLYIIFMPIRPRQIAFLLAITALAAVADAQSERLSSARRLFSTTVLANFSSWDKNRDGVLEPAELGLALQDPKVTGESAAVAAALLGAGTSKKGPKFPLWTRDYFLSNDPTIDYIVKRYKTAEKRIAHASADVMEGEHVSLKQCKQGTLGDCYLIAATGAAIARDPSVISKMIQFSPDRADYVVRYPDGVEVKVPVLTQGELAIGGAGTTKGLWLRILEKAWGVRKISNSTKLDPNEEPIDAMGHGGSVHSTLEAMTGHVAKSYRLGNSLRGPNVTFEELRSKLQEAIQAHRLIGAATPSVVTVPGISHKHAYAILTYQPNLDEVTIWNPHVNKFKPKGQSGLTAGYETIDGIFAMPLADFVATFSSISIETNLPKQRVNKSQ